MSIQLGQSHNTNTISAVQKLVRVAVQETSLNEPFTIVQGQSDSCMSGMECLIEGMSCWLHSTDIGFSGLINVAAPFSKVR